MKAINCVKVNDKVYSDLLEHIRKHITVVDELPFRIADDDPVMLRKMEEAYKTFEEAPLPDWLLKRSNGEV